jgi:CRISPR/Cas system-associated protein Cas5 (RAMP superfamily)
MRNAFKSLAALTVVLAVVVLARAEEDKKPTKAVTLKGEIGCPKCVFAVEGVTKCANAIKVTKDGKDTIYIFDDKGKGEKYHGKICTEGKKGSVTGVVSKKGDQMMIKPAKDGVKFD